MNVSRRDLITRLPAALIAPFVLRASDAGKPPGTLDIHGATRNTWLGALGEALPELQSPPPRFKAYDGGERLSLPDTESTGASFVDTLNAQSIAGQDTDLTLADVARQLRLANGVTGRQGELHLRAAPSAGALYANELYLVCERIEGLETGVYYYDVIDDALVPVASKRPAAELGGALPSPEVDAPAWLVITSVFRRYRFRYANRGYRYALIDAGHIGENFTLAARAAGLPVQRVDRFADERIEALLGVNGTDEAACAVHTLSGSGKGDDVSAVHLRPDNNGLSGADGLVERYHTATRLMARAEKSKSASVSHPRTDSPIKLEQAGPSNSIDATIRERRSTRRFLDRALSAEALRYLSRAAGAPLVHSPAFTLYVVVHRVKGMWPGLYHYKTAGHNLELIRGADMRGPLRRACLGQSKVEEAAAVFLPVADLPAAVARDGERAYRHLLLDAGALGQRIYLAAEAAGLTARNLAAFIDDNLNSLLELDGRKRAVVHLTVAGHGD